MPIINTVYPHSGTNTGDATATAAQILSPYTAYVATGKVTGTIPSQGAQTITPSTSTQTIQSGRYLSGAQTILGDSNLTASNIKSGVSIFGVLGSYSGQSGYQTSTFYNSGITISSASQIIIPNIEAKSLFGEIMFPESLPNGITTMQTFGIVGDKNSNSVGNFVSGYATKVSTSCGGWTSGFFLITISYSGGNTIIAADEYFSEIGFNNMSNYYIRVFY